MALWCVAHGGLSAYGSMTLFGNKEPQDCIMGVPPGQIAGTTLEIYHVLNLIYNLGTALSVSLLVRMFDYYSLEIVHALPH